MDRLQTPGGSRGTNGEHLPNCPGIHARFERQSYTPSVDSGPRPRRIGLARIAETEKGFSAEFFTRTMRIGGISNSGNKIARQTTNERPDFMNTVAFPKELLRGSPGAGGARGQTLFAILCQMSFRPNSRNPSFCRHQKMETR